jgi:3-methyladenine DNA glycosylase AlkD
VTRGRRTVTPGGAPPRARAAALEPTPAEIANSVRAWLREQADPACREALETLVPGARALGVRVPVLRARAAALRREHRALPLTTLADVMDSFAAGRMREEILIGAFWLARYGRALEGLPWPRIAAWVPALDNWETCDQLAMNVAARVVAADAALVSSLHRLTGARSAWARRFALATASALNQKGRVHVAEALAICAPLVADDSPHVRKAVGWALREASRHDPAAVEAFLVTQGSRAHPGVVREGSARLSAARRAALNPRPALRLASRRAPRTAPRAGRPSRAPRRRTSSVRRRS